MCNEHEGMPFPLHPHKKGKLLKLTAEIVEAYLCTFDSPPSLDELQKIIKTVFGTLKELKKECKEDKEKE